MTIDKSHRELFMWKIFQEGLSVEEAAIRCRISARTGFRWLIQLGQTGSFSPLRHRVSIPGKMPYEDQEALFAIVASNRTCHVDELTQLIKIIAIPSGKYSRSFSEENMFTSWRIISLPLREILSSEDTGSSRSWVAIIFSHLINFSS